jgi:hypothetical protein
VTKILMRDLQRGKVMSATVITVDLMSVTVNTLKDYAERARVTPTAVRYSTLVV